MFHGMRTGHLLVHCNKRIMLIDFRVLKSKSYSFFLDDELCEIKLERKGDHFFYSFDINREVDTPRNRHRKKIDKKHWRQSLLFFGSIAVLSVAFGFGIKYLHSQRAQPQLAELLENNYRTASTKVFILSPESAGLKADYAFVVNGKTYEKRISLPGIILSTGMPLEQGDEFLVRYVVGRPGINQIALDQPTEQQIERYRQRALAKHRQLHPGQSKSHIECRLGVAYQLKGIGGLADFYYQQSDSKDNPDHNNLTYNQFINNKPFRDGVEQQCRQVKENFPNNF